MKQIKAILGDEIYTSAIEKEKNIHTIIFKEEDIVFATLIEFDTRYAYQYYYRTICIKNYGLAIIISKNKRDLFLKDFDKGDLELL